MKSGFGFADYLLYLDRKAVGAVEAKAEGTLTGVEAQSAKYAAGLPENLPAHSARFRSFTNRMAPSPISPTASTPSRAAEGASASLARKPSPNGFPNPTNSAPG